MLQYKTRDDSAPKGKPWVFFCATPAETAETLPRISAEIFEFCNCAIWYDDGSDPAPTAEALEDALSQCAMAVMPVVIGLLDPAGVVQTRMLPLARKYALPLLPILEDPNLLNAFNEHFQNMQLLRRHDPDATAMPYSQRLQRFLDSKLLGNALAEQLKSAFHGCIFLSYRTPDRAMILQLLQQLQSDPQCRRIGIWYDQFLIPGKDFNDGIAQAIVDSDLFLLALTRRMVEEESYVTREEYPLALKIGKEILPVLLEELDPVQIGQQFPRIPDPTDTERAILALRSTVPTAQDTPEQNYRLGLAYLHGLHTHRSVKTALELLEISAVGGHAPAALRLANIRQQEQNNEEFHRWQQRWLRRYMELTERDYLQDPTDATAKTYADALDRLAEALMTPETAEEALRFSRDAVALLEQHRLIRECAQLCTNHGLRLTNIGRNLDGLQMHMQAMEHHVQCCKEDPGYQMQNLHPLALCYYNIGFTAKDAENFQLAQIGFQQAIACYKRLYQNDPENYVLPLSQSYGNLGTIHALLWDRTHDEADFDKAETYQGTALRLLNPWVDRDPVTYEPVFAQCCVGAAALFSRKESELDRAELFLNQALPILHHYESQYPHSHTEALAMALVNRAVIRFRRKNTSAAREDYHAALPLLRQMPWQTMTLAKTYWNLGNTYAVEENISQALPWYQQALELYESGAVQGAASSRDFADCCYNYANLLYDAGDFRKALEMAKKTVALYQGLQQGNSDAFAHRIRDRQQLIAYLERNL